MRILAPTQSNTFRSVLHGSFRKHFDEVRRAYRIFADAGIEVLAPTSWKVASVDASGFALLAGDQEQDPRLIELRYLHNLKRLGQDGFSYFVNPEGYMGKSVSYELGIAQLSNVRCFFGEMPKDHPAYIHKNAVWRPEDLVEYILEHHALPDPYVEPDEAMIHRLWENLMVPGSVVAVGGIIEFTDPRARSGQDREILLVKTHKWGGRYSMVGGKVRRNERLDSALLREVKEETGLQGMVGGHICTFDQIKNSGYYLGGVQHIFVDNVVRVDSHRVRLNEEAQEYMWAPPSVALRELDIEPNARHTLELYTAMSYRTKAK